MVAIQNDNNLKPLFNIQIPIDHHHYCKNEQLVADPERLPPTLFEDDSSILTRIHLAAMTSIL